MRCLRASVHRARAGRRGHGEVRCTRRTSPVQRRIAEVRSDEIRQVEGSPAKVRPNEVSSTELRFAKICLTEVRPTEVRLTEVRSAEVHLIEVGPAEVGLFSYEVLSPYLRRCVVVDNAAWSIRCDIEKAVSACSVVNNATRTRSSDAV